MLIAAHAISGGIAGEIIGSPIIAFLVGIIIHFVLDAVPHYDTTDKGKYTLRQFFLIIFDILFGLLVFKSIIRSDLHINASFISGVIGGITPDLLDITPYIREWFRKTRFGKPFHNLHDKIHKKDISFFPGLVIQYLAIVLVSMIYIWVRK